MVAKPSLARHGRTINTGLIPGSHATWIILAEAQVRASLRTDPVLSNRPVLLGPVARTKAAHLGLQNRSETAC